MWLVSKMSLAVNVPSVVGTALNVSLTVTVWLTRVVGAPNAPVAVPDDAPSGVDAADLSQLAVLVLVNELGDGAKAYEQT